MHIPLDVVMCLCRLIHKTAHQPPPAKPHIRRRVKDPQGRLSRAILMLEPRAAWTAGVAHKSASRQASQLASMPDRVSACGAARFDGTREAIEKRRGV